jgi:outer membrane protein assembly factor BamB
MDESLVDSLPVAPRVEWEFPAGQGFAGPAIVGGRVYLVHRVEEVERVECRDGASGKSLWLQDFPATYRGTISDDSGPRCVPLVTDTTVFVYGAAGALRALDRATGKPRWSRDLGKEFQAPEGYFGVGSTPLLIAGKLLINVGGKGGAGIVAFDPQSGKTLWKATDEAASYSAPIAGQIGDRDLALFITRLKFVAVDPETGTVLYETPFGQRGPTVNGANPVLLGDRLFLTASYGIGARFLKFTKGQLEPVWDDPELMAAQYTTPVAVNGTLFGIDGREDIGVARLVCLDPSAPKLLWAEEGFGMATLIAADGKLLILKTDGTFVLAKANPKRWEPLGEAQLFTSTTRALPALSNGLFVARDVKTWRAFRLSR